jgi:hypothetical protein
MNEIEKKALALINQVEADRGFALSRYNSKSDIAEEALCRAIEQHEAYKQRVSDALVDYFGEHLVAEDGGDALASFIIPKPTVWQSGKECPTTAADMPMTPRFSAKH